MMMFCIHNGGSDTSWRSFALFIMVVRIHHDDVLHS